MAQLTDRVMPPARRDETVMNGSVAALKSVGAAFDPGIVAMPWLEAVYRSGNR